MLDGHFTLFGYASLFSEFFVALVNSAAASLVYLVGRFFFDKKVSAFLAFVYAFSTISWPFATYFFQSDVSAVFCLLAVYFAIRVARYARGAVARFGSRWDQRSPSPWSWTTSTRSSCR